MKTPLGVYLEKYNVNRSKLAIDSGFTTDRLNALSNENEAILYADEFFPILYIVNIYAGIPLDKFDTTISEVFPHRRKGDLISNYKHLSPSAQFFLLHTQQKKELEKALGMKKNRLSKFANGDQKRATALEFIKFCDGMNFDSLETFEKYFGKITLKNLS